MTFFKLILICLGTISLGLGIIGIFVPGLPTTVFLLITAALYAKSSDKLYNKVITNKHLGPYILKYRTQKGMTIKTKFYAIGMMWAMITLSCFFFITALPVKFVVVALGIVGTIVMGFIVRTVK